MYALAGRARAVERLLADRHRPVDRDRDRLGRLRRYGLVGRAALIGLSVGLIIAALFFALNRLSLDRGGSVDLASLSDDNFRRGDTVNGFHQYNDCLILSLATDQRGSTNQLTVSPSTPYAGRADLCRALKEQKAGEPFFYHHYLHGQAMLTRYLLPILPVSAIRELYRLLTSLALMAIVAVSMLRLAQGKDAAVFLIVGLAFSRAFGLETFGQSLGHGPADFILVAFIAALMFGGGILAAAIFGALTMTFELMTGGLPLGLAVVIGLSQRPLPATVAFVCGAAAVALSKVAAVAAVFGPSAIMEMLSAGLTRTHGDIPEFVQTRSELTAIAGNLEALMPGLAPVAGCLLLLSIGFGAWGLIKNPTTEAKLLAASNLPILLWFVLFRQHTIIHAYFMDRMLVWTIASGFAIFALTLFNNLHFKPRLICAQDD